MILYPDMIYYDIHTHHPATHKKDVAIINMIVETMVCTQADKHAPAELRSAGIHPWYIDIYNVRKQLARLESISIQPDIVAIGEAGLDTLSAIPHSIQQEVFLSQALLAERVKKPLIIHCVKAWPELIATRKLVKPHMPWIIHGFRGNSILAKQLIRKGLLLSFGVHFNPIALRAAWPSSAFAETDDKETDIRLIYEQLAGSLNLPLETVILQIEKNVLNTFLTAPLIF